MPPDSAPLSKIDFTKRWILGTFVGWMLALMAIIPGVGIWEIFTSIGWQHRDSQWYQIWSDNFADFSSYLILFATLILMGLSMGLAQWRIALKGKVSKKRWLFLSSFLIITAGLGFLVSIRVSPGILTPHTTGIMSGMDAYYTLKETWLLGVLIRGAVVGAFIGLPQWIILRHSFNEAHRWLFGIILASLTVFASIVAIIAIVKSTLISISLSCCLSPMIFGAVTGVILYSLLKRPKAIAL